MAKLKVTHIEIELTDEALPGILRQAMLTAGISLPGTCGAALSEPPPVQWLPAPAPTPAPAQSAPPQVAATQLPQSKRSPGRPPGRKLLQWVCDQKPGVFTTEEAASIASCHISAITSAQKKAGDRRGWDKGFRFSPAPAGADPHAARPRARSNGEIQPLNAHLVGRSAIAVPQE